MNEAKSVNGGRRMFCSRPFEWLEIASDGDHRIERPAASLCCPGWLRDPFIPFETSAREAWNHPKAQKLRASVLDGSFRLCNEEECPYLSQGQVRDLFGDPSPVQPVESITDPRLLRILERRETVLSDGPTVLNCAYDRTCNLACPSCRTSMIGRDKASVQGVVAFQERLLADVRDSLTRLYVTGSGDPFASEAFRTLFGSLDAEDMPHLEVHLHTNGLLWTPERWAALGTVTQRMTSAEISMDAASEETFRHNRGGRWDVLLRNLEFVAQLRRDGPLRYVALSFVVQASNFREMPDFVALARDHGFDGVRFAGIRNWGTFGAEEFRTRDVAMPAHPMHAELLEVLGHPALNGPDVIVGDLFRLRAGRASSGPPADLIEEIARENHRAQLVG